MTTILGPAALPWKLGAAWAVRHDATPDFVDRAEPYWQLGALCGIRPEVAYLQHAHETGWGHHLGVVPESWHNCAGIKIARPGAAPWDGTPDPRGSDYNPNAHQRWPTWFAAICGHYNHLEAYIFGKRATAERRLLGQPHERFDVIAGLSWAGTVTTVEGLDRWAGGPGSGYGTRLAARLADFLAWGHR